MTDSTDTIYGLSSGKPPCGVAVFRLSGSRSLNVLEALCSVVPEPRVVSLREIFDPATRTLIDTGIIIVFKAPNSFTGEDCVEFQVHGGPAVVNKMLFVLATFDQCRLAEPGEFTRRSFENGRLDLVQVEGLSDLISAQTEAQRVLALNQSKEGLSKLAHCWQTEITRCRAYIEANLDFSDEDDVPIDLPDQLFIDVAGVCKEMNSCLLEDHRGEIIRDGFSVAITGPPNAGKSSLINALAKRDVAIVTSIPGTTRDVLKIELNIDGYLVIFYDTAGIRNSSDEVELAGIERAKSTANNSDLVLWLDPADHLGDGFDPYPGSFQIASKSDLVTENIESGLLRISSVSGEGVDQLLTIILKKIRERTAAPEIPMITRERHRIAIQQSSTALKCFIESVGLPIELRSESLRQASHALGVMTGHVDVEGLLDVIFSEFCIGK